MEVGLWGLDEDLIGLVYLLILLLLYIIILLISKAKVHLIVDYFTDSGFPVLLLSTVIVGFNCLLIIDYIAPAYSHLHLLQLKHQLLIVIIIE